MKLLTFLFLSILLFSCTENEPQEDVFKQEIIKGKENMNFEERTKREIEVKLSIPRTEKYRLKIYKAHLNADESEDAIITINRLEFAKNEADTSGNKVQRAELGYLGNYNYFFYYDGKLDQISNPILIASSAKAPLTVSFQNVQSEIYKDVIIDYRIRNSCFRNYYLIENGSLLLTFQWKLFDMVGYEKYEANYLELMPGTLSLAKDIVISTGKIKNYSTNISDIYTYNPIIEKSGGELYRFFYDPRTGKYMTRKKQS